MVRTITILSASLLAAGAIGGCGGDDKSGGSSPGKAPTGDAVPAAASVAQKYVDAYRKEDARAVCALLGAKVLISLKPAGGCLKAVRTSMKKQDFPQLKVLKAVRNDNSAIATFVGSPRQVTLELQGATWKVVNGGT